MIVVCVRACRVVPVAAGPQVGRPHGHGGREQSRAGRDTRRHFERRELDICLSAATFDKLIRSDGNRADQQLSYSTDVRFICVPKR